MDTIIIQLDPNLPLYQRYREIARIAGITSEDIGQALGMKAGYVRRILNGVPAHPSLMKIKAYIDEQVKQTDMLDYQPAKAA